MISFSRIDVNEMPWEELRSFDHANIFQTRVWIDFLAEVYGAEPVVAVLKSEGRVQGYFTGLIVKKFGLRILGSPFRGWNTYFMGFCLRPGVSYHEVLQAFPSFAFQELKCHFLMIIDVNVKEDDWSGLPFHIRRINNYTLDLTKTEEELFENMKNRYARRSIRRAEKRGVVVEETTDAAFIDEYYAQYQEVNERKSLPPFYGQAFVQQMITRLLPAGNLLLLRARNSQGVCIATYIDLIYNKVAVAWGAASFQRFFNLHPNELILWYGMKKLKAKGIEVLQLGDGVKDFKQKMGAHETHTFRLMQARNPLLYYPVFALISLSERVRLIMRKGVGW